MPKVSVVVAAFNAEGFIRKAYESLTSQTFTDFEIIFVDDCSRDGTLKVLEGFASSDSRVRVLRTPRNGGPSVARNLGFGAALGEWTAILDADDIFLPERLEHLVKEGEQKKLDMIADNLLLYDAGAQQVVRPGFRNDGRYRPLTVKELYRNDVPGRGFYYGWLKPMFRTQFLRGRGLSYREDLRYGEDFHFYTECFLNGGRGTLVASPLYRYTLRFGELSGQGSGLSRTAVDEGDLLRSILSLQAQYAEKIDQELAQLMEKRVKRVLASRKQALASDLVSKGRVVARSKGRIAGITFFIVNPGSWGFLIRAFLRRVSRSVFVQLV